LSGFSPANAPHLTPALEIDTAIIEFSASLASKNLPTTIKSEQDLNAIITAFEQTLRSLNLWQYYVLDATAEKEKVKAALGADKVVPWDGPDVANKSVEELSHIVRDKGVIKGLGEYASRFGTHVEAEVAAGFVQAAFTALNDHGALAEAWGRVVDVINVPLYEEWEADTKVALDSVKNRVKYTRLEEHGPKMGEISKWYPNSLSTVKWMS
jgi:glycogen debranching enzyme